MRQISIERLLLALLALIAAAVSPNIFPAAQAGLARMSALALRLLLPSLVLLAGVIAVAHANGHHLLRGRILFGIAAGLLATVALEIVRTISFRLGGMPGDLPRLLGVLMTDRFMTGPSTWSDLLGYADHFWNGASFGLIFAVIFGRRPLWMAIAFGALIGAGFLATPAVQAMGVGFFALGMPSMIATVVLAHLLYGLVLGLLLRRWLPPGSWIRRDVRLDERPAVALA